MALALTGRRCVDDSRFAALASQPGSDPATWAEDVGDDRKNQSGACIPFWLTRRTRTVVYGTALHYSVFRHRGQGVWCSCESLAWPASSKTLYLAAAGDRPVIRATALQSQAERSGFFLAAKRDSKSDGGLPPVRLSFVLRPVVVAARSSGARSRPGTIVIDCLACRRQARQILFGSRIESAAIWAGFETMGSR